MATDEVHTVVTDLDLTHTAKVVWTYMRAVTDPQHMKSMAEVLGMANGTVIRSLKALEAKGLVRRVSGVWLPEVPQ
jgi:DNA-binding MarR family transcriptional regulator